MFGSKQDDKAIEEFRNLGISDFQLVRLWRVYPG
jgi:hypothetical protein